MISQYFAIKISNYFSVISTYTKIDGWYVGRRRPCTMESALHFESEASAQRYLSSYIEHGRKKNLPRAQFDLEIVTIGHSHKPKYLVTD